jgi:hypothetical protein
MARDGGGAVLRVRGEDEGHGSQKRSNEANGENEKDYLFSLTSLPSLLRFSNPFPSNASDYFNSKAP